MKIEMKDSETISSQTLDQFWQPGTIEMGIMDPTSSFIESPIRKRSRSIWSWACHWGSRESIVLIGSFSLFCFRMELKDYQPLCQSLKHKVELVKEGYEFRPPFYHEVICINATGHQHQHQHQHHSGKLEGSQVTPSPARGLMKLEWLEPALSITWFVMGESIIKSIWCLASSEMIDSQ